MTNPLKPKALQAASILMVEPSAAIGKRFISLLQALSVTRIATAQSGEDAIYNLERGKWVADAVLFDTGSVGVRSLSFMQSIRTHEKMEIKLLPVAVVANESDTTLYEKLAHWRISGFLVKPPSQGGLKKALEAALAHHRVAIPGQPVLPKNLSEEKIISEGSEPNIVPGEAQTPHDAATAPGRPRGKNIDGVA